MTNLNLLSRQSWQNLSNETLINENYQSINKNSWQTVNDCTIIPNSQTGYCRLDRRGHWLLLASPQLIHNESNKVVTYFDNKRLSTDSNVQQTEHTFPDSCESLTVSVDFHVPTDELITDNDDIDEQNLVIWRNRLQQYENISSDETWKAPR
jgi:hypothetical protein